jgi:hypothetical protein
MHAAWDSSVMENSDPNVKITGGIANFVPKGKDDPPKLAGRNCITNEVYWRMSLLLREVLNDDSYLDPNTDEDKWFEAAVRACVLVNENNLVLERFKGVPNHTTNPKLDVCTGLEIRDCLWAAAKPTTAGLEQDWVCWRLTMSQPQSMST